MAAHWISNSRRALQRLGFLKPAVGVAGPARTRAQMTDELSAVVTKLIRVRGDTSLTSWIASKRGSLQASSVGDEIELETQAYLLYRYRARSGWLSPKGVEEYVEVLPRRLALLDEVFRPTEAGMILHQVLVAPDERSSWREGSDLGPNPMELTPGQRYFIAHSILAADGDFLIPWIGALQTRFGGRSFGYLEAGSEIPAILGEVASTFEPVAYQASDRRQLDALRAAGAKIEEEITSKKHLEGSGSRREQTSVPRLEWLVDLGILDRLNTEALDYRFTQAGEHAVRELTVAYQDALAHRYADAALQAVLDASFARAFRLILDPAGRRDAEQGSEAQKGIDIVDYLRPAYREIDSISGYCLLRTLNLLAAITAVRSGQRELIEYAKAVELLEGAYRREPGRLHYTTDRLSTDLQVRLSAGGM